MNPETIFHDGVDPEIVKMLTPHLERLVFATFDGDDIVVTTSPDLMSQAFQMVARYDVTGWTPGSTGRVHVIFGLDSNELCYSPQLVLGAPWCAFVDIVDSWQSHQRTRCRTISFRRARPQQ